MNSGKIIAVTGAVLQLGPFFGLLGTVVGMFRTFQGIALGGTSESEETAEGIRMALVTTEVGLVLGLLGTLFLLVALFANKYRAKWFYWFMMVYSILSLVALPIGTLIGIICLVYINKRKGEFLLQERVERAAR